MVSAPDEIVIKGLDDKTKERPSAEYGVMLEHVRAILESPDNLVAERVQRFIQQRLEELTSRAKPQARDLVTNPLSKGFIHPDSNVYPSRAAEPFRVDDPALYQTFLDELLRMKKDQAWGSSAVRDMIAPAILYTLGRYFGNFAGAEDTAGKNFNLYSNMLDRSFSNKDDHFSIREFKDKGAAMCTEKSAAGQNLAAFMGIDSYLIFSDSCQLETQPGQAHAYNIIVTERGSFITDWTNPRVVSDERGRDVGFQPASYPVTAEQLEWILNGKSVTVEHQGLLRHDDGRWEKKPTQKRTYGGPARTSKSK